MHRALRQGGTEIIGDLAAPPEACTWGLPSLQQACEACVACVAASVLLRALRNQRGYKRARAARVHRGLELMGCRWSSRLACLHQG